MPINNIKDILNDKYLIINDIFQETIINKNNKQITMLRKLNINKIVFNYVVYKFDKKGLDCFPFFNNIKGLHKMCDYILFAENKINNNVYTFLIELKYGDESTTMQLNAAECFVNYIIETLQRINICRRFNNIIKRVRIREKFTVLNNMKLQHYTYNKDTNTYNCLDPYNFDISEIIKLK